MSLQTQHDPKNEAEITYWNSAGGRHWVERQQSQDIVLGPILQATLERAQLRRGERVVDIAYRQWRGREETPLRLRSAAKSLSLFSKKSQMVRRDFSRAVPETLAMVDGRRAIRQIATCK